MSISEIVDTRYRMTPDDLAGRPLQVVVSNVTYQGLEDLMPVLHFAGHEKRLLLTRSNCREMIRSTGEVEFDRWIGCVVLLHPATTGRETVITIGNPDGQERTSWRSALPAPRQRAWPTALVVVSILTAFSLIYLQQNWTIIASVLDQILR